MSEEARREFYKTIEDLLAYWKIIETWVKKAEHVNKRAVIPAINELRYASRQLINATFLLQAPTLSDHDKRRIHRHLVLAEQYLINADHDVADSITSFFTIIVERIDIDVGPGNMAIIYSRYPHFREELQKSERLITESREDYTRRREIYNELRTDIMPALMTAYKDLKEAEIAARHSKLMADRAARVFDVAAMTSFIIGVVSLGLAVLSVYLTLITWPFAMSGYCDAYKDSKYDPLMYFCRPASPPSVAPPSKADPQHTSAITSPFVTN